MHARWLVVVGVLAASFSGCSYGIKAASNHDGRVDFSNYGTFFMLKGNSTGDPVRDDRLRADIKSALMSKGWVELAEGAGAAAVVVHVASSTEHTDEAFYRAWGGWRWQLNAPRGSTGSVEDYKAGTVVVTIFDADTKQAIWRGYATGAISNNPKDTVKVRDTAVARIFARLPVQ